MTDDLKFEADSVFRSPIRPANIPVFREVRTA
jgi:hypothetical protein